MSISVRGRRNIRDPLAYLFRLAFHVVGDALDRQKRDPLAQQRSPLQHNWPEGARRHVPEGVDCLSADDAEDLAVLDDMIAAFETLPKGYLTALLLVGAQGMSYREAAQASGFSVATIKSYVMHGRAALHRALEDRRRKGGAR